MQMAERAVLRGWVLAVLEGADGSALIVTVGTIHPCRSQFVSLHRVSHPLWRCGVAVVRAVIPSVRDGCLADWALVGVVGGVHDLNEPWDGRLQRETPSNDNCRKM